MVIAKGMSLATSWARMQGLADFIGSETRVCRCHIFMLTTQQRRKRCEKHFFSVYLDQVQCSNLELFAF
jgi:hypothetical protein